MKKTTLFVCAVCIAATTMGANEKYHQKMGETLGQYNTCSSIEDYKELANKFSIIANVETEEWLPLYYEAHCYIIMSFMDRTGAESKDAYLDQAGTLIEKMLELVPDESEAYALQAFYHTGRLVVNPAERAMNEAPLVSASIGKSLGLDPHNPRAKYIRLSNEIGTARFFGSDTSVYCNNAAELLDQWDLYGLKSVIHPAWGKDLVEQIVNNCGE